MIKIETEFSVGENVCIIRELDGHPQISRGRVERVVVSAQENLRSEVGSAEVNIELYIHDDGITYSRKEAFVGRDPRDLADRLVAMHNKRRAEEESDEQEYDSP